jgi:hypothetical protein
MAIVLQDHHVIILIDKAILVLTREQFIEVLKRGWRRRRRRKEAERRTSRERPTQTTGNAAGVGGTLGHAV